MVRTLAPWKGRLPQFFGEFEREMEPMERSCRRQLAANADGPGVRPGVAESETPTRSSRSPRRPARTSRSKCAARSWLTGERKQQKEEKGKTYHRIEQEYGRFERVIPLAAPVDENKIKAQYHDGILKIMVPKSEAQRSELPSRPSPQTG